MSTVKRRVGREVAAGEALSDSSQMRRLHVARTAFSVGLIQYIFQNSLKLKGHMEGLQMVSIVFG